MHTRFFSSGFNSHFYDENESFSNYITRMQDIIERTRVDLNAQNFDHIVQANSPNAFLCPDNSQEIGILLVHGLTACPFHLQDVAEHFQKQNITTHSVLLPGHGTVPGDLLDVHYHDWLQTVAYGIKCLRKHVKKIIVIGYSLGALLSLFEGLDHPDVAGMVCFAPAIQIRNPFAFVSGWHRLLSWAIPRLKWYHLDIDNDYTKYNSQCFNAIYQTYLLTHAFKNKMQNRLVDKPLFIAQSSDDEVIQADSVEAFFLKQKNPLNQMIVYTRDKRAAKHNILYKNSVYPNDNILNFSHVCLATSPQNNHNGRHGNFEEDRHYRRWWGKSYDTKRDRPKYYGAITKENLQRYHLLRLGFNPDFEALMMAIDQFIQSVVSITGGSALR